jgi:hypothetical protein
MVVFEETLRRALFVLMTRSLVLVNPQRTVSRKRPKPNETPLKQQAFLQLQSAFDFTEA